MINSSRLSTLQSEVKKIRNVAIIAHVDHGKVSDPSDLDLLGGSAIKTIWCIQGIS